MAQLVKNPSAKRETWVRSLDQEDPLEKEMATHSSVLALISYYIESKECLEVVKILLDPLP